jgi:hypothetical protein
MKRLDLFLTFLLMGVVIYLLLWAVQCAGGNIQIV